MAVYQDQSKEIKTYLSLSLLRWFWAKKFKKLFDLLNLVVLSISGYVENDGKIGFYKKPENWSQIGH